jgi:protein-tyrosine phosphatase
MAEHLMWDGLVERLGEVAHAFEVSSAGTRGFSGDPMQPYAHSTLASYGIDGSDFVARAVEQAMVEEADLVLTATRHHRGKVVTLSPKASRRTFTLRELSRLLSVVRPEDIAERDPVERTRALIQRAVANRGLVLAERPEDDDLEDPYTRPEADYVTCAGLIQEALRHPLDLIAGVRSSG